MINMLLIPNNIEVYSSIWKAIWDEFNRLNGLIFALIGIAISIFIGFVKDITIAAFIFIILMFLLIIWTLFKTSFNFYSQNRDLSQKRNGLPRVIFGSAPYPQNPRAIALCLLEPSDLFSYNTLVSFYHYYNGFEQFIGLGEVVNIQENGNIQVEMDFILENHKQIIEKITQNNGEWLSQIRVKPFIPKAYIESYLGATRIGITTNG